MFWLFHTVIYFLIHLKILFHFVSDMKNKKNKSSERVFSWFLSLSFFYFCICCFTHGEKNTLTLVLNKIWADLWLECQMVSKNPTKKCKLPQPLKTTRNRLNTTKERGKTTTNSKKKRPQTTRVSKLLDSKQKQHYLPMNLKPPQTQSHHTLRSTRNWLKIAGKRAKLPDSKQQNYETSKQKTHKQKDMRVKTTVKRCRTTIARLKSMRKTLKTTTKRCKTTRGSKQSKLQKMLNRYRTLKHAHTIQDHSLYGRVALCVCVCVKLGRNTWD